MFPFPAIITLSDANKVFNISGILRQRALTYFVRGSIAVRLTSCLTGLDLTKLVNLYLVQHKQVILKTLINFTNLDILFNCWMKITVKFKISL